MTLNVVWTEPSVAVAPVMVILLLPVKPVGADTRNRIVVVGNECRRVDGDRVDGFAPSGLKADWACTFVPDVVVNVEAADQLAENREVEVQNSGV